MRILGFLETLWSIQFGLISAWAALEYFKLIISGSSYFRRKRISLEIKNVVLSCPGGYKLVLITTTRGSIRTSCLKIEENSVLQFSKLFFKMLSDFKDKPLISIQGCNWDIFQHCVGTCKLPGNSVFYKTRDHLWVWHPGRGLTKLSAVWFWFLSVALPIAAPGQWFAANTGDWKQCLDHLQSSKRGMWFKMSTDEQASIHSPNLQWKPMIAKWQQQHDNERSILGGCACWTR